MLLIEHHAATGGNLRTAKFEQLLQRYAIGMRGGDKSLEAQTLRGRDIKIARQRGANFSQLIRDTLQPTIGCIRRHGFFATTASIACCTSSSSGLSLLENRFTTTPLRSTRYL